MILSFNPGTQRSFGPQTVRYPADLACLTLGE